MVPQVRYRVEFKHFNQINDYLALLFQRTSSRIDAIICRAVRNPSDRDDVRQEACKKVLENSGKFLDCTSEAHMVNLMLRMIRFSCAEYIRAKGRRIKVCDSAELPETLYVPMQEIDREGALESVRQALKSLSPIERVVLRLRYYERLRRADIAEVLDMSESQVKSLLERIVRMLRIYLSFDRGHNK